MSAALLAVDVLTTAVGGELVGTQIRVCDGSRRTLVRPTAQIALPDQILVPPRRSGAWLLRVGHADLARAPPRRWLAQGASSIIATTRAHPALCALDLEGECDDGEPVRTRQRVHVREPFDLAVGLLAPRAGSDHDGRAHRGRGGSGPVFGGERGSGGRRGIRARWLADDHRGRASPAERAGRPAGSAALARAALPRPPRLRPSPVRGRGSPCRHAVGGPRGARARQRPSGPRHASGTRVHEPRVAGAERGTLAWQRPRTSRRWCKAPARRCS